MTSSSNRIMLTKPRTDFDAASIKVTITLMLFVLMFSACTSFGQVELADPFVLNANGKYYLYGTNDRRPNDGIPVLVSTDLQNWSSPQGQTEEYLALDKNQNYGTKGFWAPCVLFHNNRYYMFYTANENIAVASSESPAGPFTNGIRIHLQDSGKAIDPHIFIDDNGKKYLYFVKLLNGNRTFGAELSDDLLTVKPGSVVECINASQPWETTSGTQWPVTEAPSMLKHNNKYFLFYTANDFRSPAYNVGYAVADSPLGPFKKFTGNPIIKRSDEIPGTGGCDFLSDTTGELIMFYHAHAGKQSVTPRKTLYSIGKFVTDSSGATVFQVSAEKRSLKKN